MDRRRAARHTATVTSPAQDELIVETDDASAEVRECGDHHPDADGWCNTCDGTGWEITDSEEAP